MLKPIGIFLCSLSLLSTAREVSISGRVMCGKQSAPNGLKVHLLTPGRIYGTSFIATTKTSPDGEYNVTGTVDDSVEELSIQVDIDCQHFEALKRCWSVHPGIDHCPKGDCFYEIAHKLIQRNLIIGNFTLTNENVDVFDKGESRTCSG